jgi:hypothetical protein
MPIHSITGYAALVSVLGALACGGGQARTEDTPEPEQAAAARDTTTDTLATERDTLGGDAQNPPGYRGMERDTTLAPPSEQTPSDTFLQNQGQGQPQDTAGYTGMERAPAYPDTGYVADTTGAAAVPDTSGAAPADTTQSLDTTGYNPSQEQPRDTTGQ